jgi:hypothetical protein
MNLDVFSEVKNNVLEKELKNEIEVGNLDSNMNDLNEKLQKYLDDNKEPNRQEKRFNIPIDFEMDVEKNNLGDTTILGKVTIEKSAMKDLEKIQDKTMSGVKSVLDKVYDVVKDTFIEKAADKVLSAGSKILKIATKAVGTLGRKILKI